MEYTSDESQENENFTPMTDNGENSVNISSSCIQVPASTIVNMGYGFAESDIIPSEDISGSFFQSGSIIEFYAYSITKNLLSQEYNFTDYTIEENTATPNTTNATSYTNSQGIAVVNTGSASIPTNNITLQPTVDLYGRGFDNGELFAVYNFINYELASSPTESFYISEISGDRTEIRIKSNVISPVDIKNGFSSLKDKLNSTEYFDEFYLSFYQNNYVVAVNIALENTAEKATDPSILIKLYEPLPANYNAEQRLYVATKVGETVAYKVEFIQDFSNFIDNANYIKGPNINIPLQDLVNNSTTLKSYDDLTKTESSSSLDSVLNYLNQTGVTITPNYSYNTFDEFINFSSAKQRINNFYEKVSQIQSYQSDIDTITTITGSNPNVIEISQSLSSLQTNITNLVSNFDGYESYLYYDSSSFAYPKTGSSYPYSLQPTGSTEVLTWMGSNVENSQYYGGYRLSASLYDEDNQNWLYYTIPTFITENSDNNEYVEFSNMVGQSFDEVWLYTKALSERYNTTNDPESGLPLDLAADAIKGLGFETFGNNYDNQDNFIGLTGEDNGIYVPPTGSELITDYVAVNNGKIINYWNLGYSWLNYVEQLIEPGFPYAIDKVSKEIYKRLYHNMAYLTKKKGTISGLRQLINIWGIPNTILRINEFGGKNKDNSDDYDLWYKRYSYAYTPVANQYMASSSVKIPWMPLQRNKIDFGLNTTLTAGVVNTPITTGTIINGGTLTATATGFYQIDRYFTRTGNGQYGGLLFQSDNGVLQIQGVAPPSIGVADGVPSTGWPSFSTNGEGINYQAGDQITITGAQINQLNDANLGQGWTGTITLTLTNLNVQDEGGGYIVPDGLAFRFKTTGHPSSSYGGKFYSQSLAVKKSNGINDQQMDWGIGLFYEDQPSGSYSGSSFSDYYNYGKLRFYMSASQPDGGVQISDDISLPFFDGGWWSVLLQRDQHVSASDNDTPVTYTLFAANKQVDGWDGNSLGWSGSVSMSSANTAFNSGYGGGTYDDVTYDIAAAVKPTINKSWNSFGVTEYDGVYVGGYVSGSDVMTEVLNEGAKIFSGSFQEFRYYSNNISKEVFNDFVMNPESIEGNKITGSESSFDIVNFRAPLGNELEYKFTSSISGSFITLISSSHPAITGSAPMVFTQSFINPSNSTLTSSYEFIGYEAASTYTYSKPNVETYFLDQPAIGIRNRISNKIQVDDGNDYGNVLSKYRSIDQDYLISKSYTEDITSLEVGFSPQDEVNDDIIATYGYGVISDVLADPRFAYEGKENYYPKLRNIANDYFKKYTEGDIWDYLRLIKYFDNSLFKAIKSYVPARTSVTTGVIVKQHMLERNRRVPITVNPNTIIAYTPETGSIVGGQSTATGMNSPISYRDLELTGSIEMVDIDGSTGGVLNPYNVEVTQSGFFSYFSSNTPGNVPDQYINLIPQGGNAAVYGDVVLSKFGTSLKQGLRLKTPIKTRFSFYQMNSVGQLGFDEGFEFAVSSSLRGIIGTDIITSASLSPIGSTAASSSYYEMIPGEDITFWLKGMDVSDPNNPIPASVTMQNLLFSFYTINQPNANDFQGAISPFSSSIWNSFTTQSYIIENKTISGSVYELHKSQDEFYNGEFSGSEITVTTQSLLVNPFSEPNTINTTYNLTVTASFGAYQNSSWNTTDPFQNTFPSASFDLQSTSSFYDPTKEGLGLDQIYNLWGEWELNKTFYRRTGSIFYYQDPLQPEDWWIVGLILPSQMNFVPGQSTPSTKFGTLLGWNTANLNNGELVVDTQSKFTPIPPAEANINPINQVPPEYSGIPAIIDGKNTPNQWGPYIKFPSTSGSMNQFYAVGLNVDYGPTDPQYNNMEWEKVFSNMLGNNDAVLKYYSTTALDPTTKTIVSTTSQYGITKYWFKEPWNNGGRPIRLSDATSYGPPSTPDVFTETVRGIEVLFSPERIQRTKFADNQKDGTLNNYGIGSASLALIGSTWTGSIYDGSGWFPEQLTFNNETQDPDTGVINNNLSTFANEPSFELNLPNYIGTPTPIDSYGKAGNKFIQSLNDLEGISFLQDATSPGWTVFNYNPQNSRYLSGSVIGSFPLIQYNPSGPQESEYVNFNPQLPPNNLEFENSAYYPLINNATESVKNTYLQVVDYDNGPIPSNIELIISQSALKARVPDSFYTQKSSIIPRYLGSKLQSADYNTYTPPLTNITYLNGNITGSVFSRSNETFKITTVCFVEGTKISLTGDSVKNVEDFKSGDPILTYNPDDNKQEEGVVGNIDTKSVTSLIEITFDNGNILQTTEEHPFYVKDKGLVNASELKPLDICKTINEDLSTITTVNKIKGDYKVYNLIDVSPNSNYYANGILVHNKSTIVTTYTSPPWLGDSNPQQMPSEGVAFSTISKHPIYFAHYRSSKETYELWDSTTFNIDQLIESPLDDVRGDKAPITPIVINIDGSDNQITEVRSTFEVDRKSDVSYNVGKVKGLSGSLATINYSSLAVGDNTIYQGALEYNALLSNQNRQTSYAKFMAFNTGSIFGMYKTTGSGAGVGFATSSNFVDLTLQKPPGSGGWSLSSGFAGFNFFLSASEDTDPNSPNYQGGYLKLCGGGMTITASAEVLPTFASTYQWISGPGLGAIHSVNKCLQKGQFATNIVTGQDNQIGWPIGSKRVKQDSIYFTWDVGQSANATSSLGSYASPNPLTKGHFPQIANYQDYSLPFLIEKGDEIRIAYSSSVGSSKSFINEQDFTVVDVPHSPDDLHGYVCPGLSFVASVNSASIFDRIYVSPNPMNFDIESGKIFNFTIRRRVNASDRVIIFQSNPTGSEGARTFGPSGYLIPGDFTPIQKRNVQTLINQLRAKNAFRADEDNDTRRTPIE
tara:strand:+ start:5684 stop:14206 length:8523 start_codon:yes stop_codon:yes gene_type:complete